MTRFFSFSLFLLVVSSCGSLPELEGFHQVSLSEKVFAENPYFSGSQAQVYKARISVYGNELGGILALRKMNDSLYRAAFLSDFGTKLLDISFSENYSKLNYTIKKLDKNYIITTLVMDFRLLTIPRRKVVQIYENTTTSLLKTKIENGFVYFYYEKEKNRLKQLTKTNGRTTKTSIYFKEFKGSMPQTIEIVHQDLNLKINLDAINLTHAD